MPRRSILNGHDDLSSLLGGVQIKGRERFRKMTEEAILAPRWTRKQFWRVGDELAQADKPNDEVSEAQVKVYRSPSNPTTGLHRFGPSGPSVAGYTERLGARRHLRFHP